MNMGSFAPAYIETRDRGLLKEKIGQAHEILKACTLCPREMRGGIGSRGKRESVRPGSTPWCPATTPILARRTLWWVENGSGTIFFAQCNLLCIFCQNYDISHQGEGVEFSSQDLARVMLSLQARGCHNINFVTPSHVVPQILTALDKAAEGGLKVPLVYNTSWVR